MSASLQPTAVKAAEPRAERALTRAEYERFLPLVRRTAMRMARKVPRHITVQDLVGYGWIGLLEAYRRADPNMPSEEFEAYASYRVKGAILDFLRGLDPVARQTRQQSRKLTGVIRDLTDELGRAPEEAEIAARLGVSKEDYRDLLSAIGMAGMARLELIDIDRVEVESGAAQPDEEVERRSLFEAVVGAIDKLPERLQQLLALQYEHGCSQREIAEIFGVHESRICQLRVEAIHRLRAAIGGE